MGVKVLVAAPTNLLTTLGRIKAELGITDTANDDLLFDMLTEASSAITRECGRSSFGVQTVEEWLKGTGSQILATMNAPLLQVSSIYEDGALVDQTDPNTGYWIDDADAGAIYRPAGWGQTVALLSWGWESYASRYILPGGTTMLRYKVTYTAGYLMPGQEDYVPYDPTAGTNPAGLSDPQPLPGDVVRGCIETVKSWWFNRARDPYLQSVQADDVRVQYNMGQVGQASLPLAVLGMIRNYRRVN